jgi:hypothetical protein
MADSDIRKETPNRRDNEEEIVGQPVDQPDDDFEDDEDDDAVEDVSAEEGE